MWQKTLANVGRTSPAPTQKKKRLLLQRNVGCRSKQLKRRLQKQGSEQAILLACFSDVCFCNDHQATGSMTLLLTVGALLSQLNKKTIWTLKRIAGEGYYSYTDKKSCILEVDLGLTIWRKLLKSLNLICSTCCVIGIQFVFQANLMHRLPEVNTRIADKNRSILTSRQECVTIKYETRNSIGKRDRKGGTTKGEMHKKN